MIVGNESMWDRKFLAITDLYAKEFFKSENTDDYIRSLSESAIRLSVLCVTYSILVRLGKIDPIRNLPDSEKEDLKSEVSRLTHSDDEKHKQRLAKVIYTLGMYIQL